MVHLSLGCCHPDSQFKGIYPLAVINVVGNVLTNVSLGLVAVSFTHTVKVCQSRRQCSTRPMCMHGWCQRCS